MGTSGACSPPVSVSSNRMTGSWKYYVRGICRGKCEFSHFWLDFVSPELQILRAILFYFFFFIIFFIPTIGQNQFLRTGFFSFPPSRFPILELRNPGEVCQEAGGCESWDWWQRVPELWAEPRQGEGDVEQEWCGDQGQQTFPDPWGGNQTDPDHNGDPGWGWRRIFLRVQGWQEQHHHCPQTYVPNGDTVQRSLEFSSAIRTLQNWVFLCLGWFLCWEQNTEFPSQCQWNIYLWKT